jgi:hypothetical protein
LNPKNRGYLFLRNVGLSPNYTVLQPARAIGFKSAPWNLHKQEGQRFA